MTSHEWPEGHAEFVAYCEANPGFRDLTPFGWFQAGMRVGRLLPDEIRRGWLEAKTAEVEAALRRPLGQKAPASDEAGRRRAQLGNATRAHVTPGAFGAAQSGGTFSTYLGTLRRNGLVSEHGGVVVATSVVWP